MVVGNRGIESRRDSRHEGLQSSALKMRCTYWFTLRISVVPINCGSHTEYVVILLWKSWLTHNLVKRFWIHTQLKQAPQKVEISSNDHVSCACKTGLETAQEQTLLYSFLMLLAASGSTQKSWRLVPCSSPQEHQTCHGFMVRGRSSHPHDWT